LGDKCAERLRCEKAICVDDPNALVPEADDWDITVVRGPMKDCGCASKGREGRTKLEIFTKDAVGRTVHIRNDPQINVLLTNEKTGITFEPSRRRRDLGYSNGTAVGFVTFDESAPYTVKLVATHNGMMRELDKFAVTVCDTASQIGSAGCACKRKAPTDKGTCDDSRKCNADRNQCAADTSSVMEPSTGLPTGAIIGIVIGALCAIVMALLIAFLSLRAINAREEARFEMERQNALRSDAMMAGTSQAYRDIVPGGTESAAPTIVLPSIVANGGSTLDSIPLPPRPAPTRALPGAPAPPKTYGSVTEAMQQGAMQQGAIRTYGSTTEAIQSGAGVRTYGSTSAIAPPSHTASAYGSRVFHTEEQYFSTSLVLANAPPRPLPSAPTVPSIHNLPPRPKLLPPPEPPAPAPIE
jgi:hypothetical protein